MKGKAGAKILSMRREAGQKVESLSNGHADAPMEECVDTRRRETQTAVSTAIHRGKGGPLTALAHAVAATKTVRDGRPRVVKADLKRITDTRVPEAAVHHMGADATRRKKRVEVTRAART